jgi:hypothetical protein
MAKPRSLDQHKRFFALMAAAFHHWPHSHPFKPKDAEHLRAWLLVRAEHCFIHEFEVGAKAGEFAKLIPIIGFMMFRCHSWTKVIGNNVAVCVPQSIAFDKLGHNAFGALNNDVDQIIRNETGLDPEQLLREKAA